MGTGKNKCRFKFGIDRLSKIYNSFYFHMKTIIIILNYKTFDETIAITNKLLLDKLGDRRILIVDNASPNESFEVLENTFLNESKVEVISSGKNGGYAKGNNFALRYIKKYEPQYACIINNDVHFNISLIEKLEARYPLINGVAVLAPVQYLPSRTPASFLNLKNIPSFLDDVKNIIGLGKLSRHVYQPTSPYSDLQEVCIIPGAFLFVNYLLFEKLGFFYEGTFLFGEERFLARKVKDNHLHNYILLDECYIHAHSVTINNEATKLKQQRMLFDSKIIYTKCYRTFPMLKVCIMYILYYLILPLRFIKYKMRRCKFK